MCLFLEIGTLNSFVMFCVFFKLFPNKIYLLKAKFSTPNITLYIMVSIKICRKILKIMFGVSGFGNNVNNFTALKLKLFDFLVKVTFYDVQQFFSHSE